MVVADWIADANSTFEYDCRSALFKDSSRASFGMEYNICNWIGTPWLTCESYSSTSRGNYEHAMRRLLQTRSRKPRQLFLAKSPISKQDTLLKSLSTSPNRN